MANHKSALKAIRKSEKRRLHNRYYAKTMRNAVRQLRAMTNKEEATVAYPKVQKMLDKMAKTKLIHKNKAANIKFKTRFYEWEKSRTESYFNIFLENF
jgi:small subunit ribosomal protein S20